MKTNPTPAVVSTTSTPATVVPGGFTLGLDLGDRRHYVCVLNAAGQIVREDSLTNTRPVLAQLLAGFPKATADALRFYRVIRAGREAGSLVSGVSDAEVFSQRNEGQRNDAGRLPGVSHSLDTDSPDTSAERFWV